MNEYIGHYEKRLYFSLDIDHEPTPLITFADKRPQKRLEKATQNGWRTLMTSGHYFYIIVPKPGTAVIDEQTGKK